MPHLVAHGALAIAAMTAVLSLSAPAAHAQTTFDDTTGVMWGVGGLELTVLATAVVESLDVCDVCGIAVLVAGIAATIPTAIAAQLGEWPSDVPFVFHETAWASVASVMLLAPWLEDAAALAGIAIGLGAGTYSFIRRDTLLRSPDTAPWTHFMAWIPPATLLGMLASARKTSDAVLVIAGAGYLALWGIAVAGAELAAD